MLTLMKLKAEIFLRIWFLIVVILGIALGLNAFIIDIPNSAIIAFIVAIPLGLLKIFQRNMILHNLTEVLIYPGIATVFIPILNIFTVVILLVLISIYDMYAVWHAGFMQKMAKYQIEQLKIFSGFFIPYLGKKDRVKIKLAKSKGKKSTKVKVNLAILGGGDVIFPILLSGVVLISWGLIPALMIPLGATAGLSYLFYKSEKGKFYPAMPFISIGCLIALLVAYLIA
jgi:presenilin-like A22 family membrane protease